MTTFEQADRLKQIPPYLFVRLEQLSAEKKAQGWDMIDFGIGDPDLPAPECVVDAMYEAAKVNENQKYSSSAGEKDLRVAVAQWYKKRYNLDIDPDTSKVSIVRVHTKDGSATSGEDYHPVSEGMGALRVCPDELCSRCFGAGILEKNKRNIHLPEIQMHILL